MVGPLAKKFSVRTISFCSYILLGSACLIFGPSHLLGLDTFISNVADCNVKFKLCSKNATEIALAECKIDFLECRGEAKGETYAMLIGSLVLLGTAAGSAVVPILLELVQAIKDEMGVKPGANERGSALFTMGSALGSIIGNWLGGSLYRAFKNPTTCDIMAGLAFSMAIFYFIMNIWPGVLLRKNKEDSNKHPDQLPTPNHPQDLGKISRLLEED